MASVTPASTAIANAPHSVAPVLSRCEPPNRTADSVTAIHVPNRFWVIRKITPRKRSSSLTAALAITPTLVRNPQNEPPAKWSQPPNNPMNSIVVTKAPVPIAAPRRSPGSASLGASSGTRRRRSSRRDRRGYTKSPAAAGAIPPTTERGPRPDKPPFTRPAVAPPAGTPTNKEGEPELLGG